MRPGSGRCGRGVLPRAGRALQGWRRGGPARSRLPLPWEVVALLALTLVQLGGARHGGVRG
eukprot:4080718-Lingulodinium_polyedra.AAC.1